MERKEAEEVELEEPAEYTDSVPPARKEPKDYRSGSNFISRLLFMYGYTSVIYTN